MRFLIIGFLALLAIPSAQAITAYDISLAGNDALVNLTFELYAPAGKKVNYFTTSFAVPENAILINAADSKGTIDAVKEGDEIIVETHKGGLREREVVNLLYQVPSVVASEFSTLSKVNFSLAGFSDDRPDVPEEQTYVTFRAEEELISFITSFGVSGRIFKGNELQLQGTGPLSFTAFFGQGTAYTHFVLFGNAKLAEADQSFGIISAITGLAPPQGKLPIVVLGERAYERQINDWSAGEYRGGYIVFKRDQGKTTTLLHEGAHAVTADALSWEQAHVAWFDEGVAKYVEFAFNTEAGAHQAEIFGNPVQWREGLTVYTLPPRGTADDLWEYYQSRQLFMSTWTPEIPETRDFGYAFSELVIRDFIKRKGPDALQGVFAALKGVDRVEKDPVKANSLFELLLETDLRPCHSSSRAVFDACLEELNVFKPIVTDTVIINGKEEAISIPDLAPPAEESSIIYDILYYLQGILEQILNFFSGAFK